MKRTIIALFLLVFVGCSNDTMQGYLTVNCTRENIFNNTININTISIKHRDNNIVSIRYSYKYQTESELSLDSYKQSLIAESNKYSGKNIGISQNEQTNSFEIIYNIDLSIIDQNIKQELKIEHLASNEIKKLELEGYSCK